MLVVCEVGCYCEMVSMLLSLSPEASSYIDLNEKKAFLGFFFFFFFFLITCMYIHLGILEYNYDIDGRVSGGGGGGGKSLGGGHT